MFGYFKRRSFRKELEKALADGVLTDDEVKYLEARSDELGVDQEYVDKIRREHFNKQVALIKEKIEETRRFSPDDEARIRRLAEGLKIELDLEIGPGFKAFRCLWAWENGYPMEPEPMIAPMLLDRILLNRGEACYFVTVARWQQVKSFKERSGSSSFSTSVQIMEGVSCNFSTTFEPEFRTWEALAEVSKGVLYLTNKRVIFEGAGRTTSISCRRLIGLQGYANGIELKKSTGKNDFFHTDTVLSAEYSMALIRHFAAEG